VPGLRLGPLHRRTQTHRGAGDDVDAGGHEAEQHAPPALPSDVDAGGCAHQEDVALAGPGELDEGAVGADAREAEAFVEAGRRLDVEHQELGEGLEGSGRRAHIAARVRGERGRVTPDVAAGGGQGASRLTRPGEMTGVLRRATVAFL